MTGATRDVVLNYAKQQYGTVPEVLWPKTPRDVVLRHNVGKKWYAIIMEVRADKFGGSHSDMVDVMNVKCQPDVVEFLWEQDGIFPAYHMNKKHWVSILLNGKLDAEKVFGLLDFSYKLTLNIAKAPKNKSEF